eukprot:scaffold8823_cov162-Isochrysis_galbana.AAC.2
MGHAPIHPSVHGGAALVPNAWQMTYSDVVHRVAMVEAYMAADGAQSILRALGGLVQQLQTQQAFM